MSRKRGSCLITWYTYSGINASPYSSISFGFSLSLSCSSDCAASMARNSFMNIILVRGFVSIASMDAWILPTWHRSMERRSESYVSLGG